MPIIELIQGNIVEQTTDAIVNAANSALMGGSGVDGAIHRAGGPEILEECKKIRKTEYPHGLPTGRAVATTAGKLKARYVIHTVGPIYERSANPAAELSSCYKESLWIADRLQLSSISFPAISTGVYGYPMKEAAEVSLSAVMNAQTKVSLVRFVLFDALAFMIFQETWNELNTK